MQAIQKILKVLTLAVCIAGYGSLSSYAQSSAAGNFVVQSYPIPTTIMLGGTVIPSREVTLSAQLPGRIEMIAGGEGEQFEKEALLVALDATELLAQRRSAWAEMMSAQSTLRNADIQYWKEMVSPDSTSKAPGGMGIPYMFDKLFTEQASDMMTDSNSNLDRYATYHTYKTQLEQARNTVMRASSQIEAIDAKLRDARSIAPFAGVITKKMVEVGDTVQPGMPLLKFMDIKQLQIRAEVPARLVPGLQVGMVVRAKLDVGGWGQVRVAQIFPMADDLRHTVTVKFDLPQGTQTRPGQYSQVEIQDITTPPRYYPVVPKNALVWRGSLPGVYVVSSNKRELRLLRLGDDYGNNMITILSGLTQGETIEVSPEPGTTSGWISQPQPQNH